MKYRDLSFWAESLQPLESVVGGSWDTRDDDSIGNMVITGH